MENLETSKKRVKTGGRQPGSVNKRTKTGRRLMERVLRRQDLVAIAEELLHSKDDRVRVQTLGLVLAYLFGKPKEQVSHSVGITVYDAVAKARARVLRFEQTGTAAPSAPVIEASIETTAEAAAPSEAKPEESDLQTRLNERLGYVVRKLQ